MSESQFPPSQAKPLVSSNWRLPVFLLIASVLAYLPALTLPFIADDFVQIPLSTQYFAHGWTTLLADPKLRTRATYMALDALVYHAFGFTPMPFYAVSILLHACCTLGVYTLAVLCTADTVTAFAAACFLRRSKAITRQ